MFKVLSKAVTTIDRTGELKKQLAELAKKQVYVGIPQKGNSERDGGIKQAELLYILTHGVRSKAMREEMNDSMGIDSQGMPFTNEFNQFSQNLSKGMPYSAAYALYIHSHGSPLWRIPPRPVLEPAVEKYKKYLENPLKQAAIDVLDGRDPDNSLHHAGMMAQNFVHKWFRDPDNHWPANAESTVKMKGSDRPMIDKGELRRAITYVVKG